MSSPTGKSAGFDIPYRLETLDDVLAAKRVDLLGLGATYDVLLRVARRTCFSKPPALLAAQREVRKEFYQVKEETIRQSRVRYEEIASLSPIRDFHRIEATIPWANEIATHADFVTLLRGFPAQVQKACLVDPPPRSPMAVYESGLAIRRVIRQEMLVHVKARQTKWLTLDELKRLVVAYCVFMSANDDILHALRSSDGRSHADALYQNALAELLFCRLPESLALFVAGEPAMIRQKVFAKIAELDMTTRQRTNLYGYFAPNVSRSDLPATLERLDSVAQRMRLEEATRQRLRDYLSSLSRSVERASGLYEEWFLADREIRQMRGLHISDKVMKSSVTYADKILRTRTKLAELRFYPTKDYLDLCRGQISGDCIDTVLSEQQLARPEFFNIRVFSEGQWIGNIYMLDFTGEQSILLIDRIQIPRQLKVPYLDFFEQLTQALREMFEALPYECILAPLAISNHATIQKAFNTYRKKLRKHEVQLPCTHARYFDSLRTGSGYYALCQKEGISQSFR